MSPVLDGVKVIDVAINYAGPTTSMYLADQGADVIKIENSAFPDGLRQTRKNSAMNASFAWGARNKRGLGLDLRSEEGRQIVRDLVRTADVVTGNFKPGTLDSLGLSVSAVRPRDVAEPVTDAPEDHRRRLAGSRAFARSDARFRRS